MVERVAIPSDGFTLEAAAELRDGAPGAVMCHPHPAFGGRMDTPLVVELAEALAGAGLSTVRFNFRGLGESGGTATGGVSEEADVRAAAAWLRARGAPRVALVGYSFGALMAARALARGEAAQAYAAVGFPTTILGDDAERLGDMERALGSGVPSLFVQGDEDPFCRLERVRSWARPTVTIDVRAGEGHFFAGGAAQEVAAVVARFVAAALR